MGGDEKTEWPSLGEEAVGVDSVSDCIYLRGGLAQGLRCQGGRPTTSPLNGLHTTAR